jgi:hypothetical protein
MKAKGKGAVRRQEMGSGQGSQAKSLKNWEMGEGGGNNDEISKSDKN